MQKRSQVKGIPIDSSALAAALVSVIPSVWIQMGFYIGVIALIISTMVGLSIVCVTSFCQAMGLVVDSKKWYIYALALAPNIGFFGAYIGKPVMVVVTVAAMQSLFNWLSGNSWYLLGNNTKYLGKYVIQSRLFNVGILITISILNIVFVTFILMVLGIVGTIIVIAILFTPCDMNE